jgi:hypothetical protein
MEDIMKEPQESASPGARLILFAIIGAIVILGIIWMVRGKSEKKSAPLPTATSPKTVSPDQKANPKNPFANTHPQKIKSVKKAKAVKKSQENLSDDEKSEPSKSVNVLKEPMTINPKILEMLKKKKEQEN